MESKALINDVEWLSNIFDAIPKSVRFTTCREVNRFSNLSNTYYREVRKAFVFPIVLYAPPYSGKTTLRNSEPNLFCDTDELFTMGFRSICLTNMSKMLQFGRVSIAFVPSRAKFKERCEHRNLKPVDNWYDDVLKNLQYCDRIFCTDEYLMEVIDSSWLIQVLTQHHVLP